MFLIGLRGKIGFILSFAFHVLIIVSFFVMFMASSNGIIVSVFVLHCILCVILLRYMHKRKDDLKFSGPFMKMLAFPKETHTKILMGVYHVGVGAVPLVIAFLYLFGVNDFDSPNNPGFLVFFYVGSLGLIGGLNILMQRLKF